MKYKLLMSLMLASPAALAADMNSELSEIPANDNEIVCNVDGELVATTDKSKCEKTKHGAIRNWIDEQNISLGGKIIGVEIADSLKLGLKYKYEVEPSKSGETFTRVDRWSLDTGLKPGNLLDNSPIYLRMDKDTEILFAQFFDNGAEARSLKNTYTPKMIPLSAKKALKLKTGDFVRFNAYMNLATGLQEIVPVGTVAELSARIGLLVSGQYQVYINRLDGEKVRVQFIGERSKGSELGLNFGASSALEIVGIDLVDDLIVDALDLDEVLSLSIQNTTDHLFVVDYTLDLSNAEAAQAYDDVFNSLKKFPNSYKVANPISSKVDLQNKLISNVMAMETLAKEDMLIADEDQRSVVRNVKASNTSDTSRKRFKFGLLSFRADKNEIIRDNFLVNVRNDGTEEKDYYLYPSWTLRSDTDRGLIPRLFRIGEGLDEEVTQSANAIFESNADQIPTRFVNLGFGYTYEDREMSKSEVRQLIAKMSGILPSERAEQELAQKIDAAGYLKKDNDRARVQLNYYMHEAALLKLIQSSAFGKDRNESLGDNSKVLKYELLNYLNDLGIYDDDLKINAGVFNSKRKYKGFNKPGFSEGKANALEVFVGRQISGPANRLATVFNSSADSRERYDAFTSLTKSRFFRKHGTSFLIGLLERVSTQEEMVNVVAVDFQMTAKNRGEVQYSYGVNHEREHQEIIAYLDKILNLDSDNNDEWRRIHELMQNNTIVQSDLAKFKKLNIPEIQTKNPRRLNGLKLEPIHIKGTEQL